ncbi:NADPH dehydrogenase [Candidatus Falkowbacteria bacterium HGW-Falkowbacteria-2]|uniref:NADPH dehydrogenase n=1 Tax=Candidatus Falkowbacteria bacterium HGW-Falkowbacteria-2 TaxID=2013769 RepID=A0A2N2E3Y3_9BACT|nr:MAG: NADPH dehydrogenase [Candidatus Falkowbacteria bacterium HGW-Falkowbacteria-2]
MSKYLIIYANPRHEGHSGYLLQQVESRLAARGADFEVIDLYRIGYDPILKPTELYSAPNRVIDPQNIEFQKKIKAATSLLFIYPTWWQAPPAILKGFIDRVFTSGFAFTYVNGLPIGLLKDKKAAAFTTSGSPAFFHFITGNPALKVLLKYTLAFCGMRTKGFSLGRALHLNENGHELELTADRIVEYIM